MSSVWYSDFAVCRSCVSGWRTVEFGGLCVSVYINRQYCRWKMSLVDSWGPSSSKMGTDEITFTFLSWGTPFDSEKKKWHVIALFNIKLQNDYSLNGGRTLIRKMESATFVLSFIHHIIQRTVTSPLEEAVLKMYSLLSLVG